MKFGDKLPFPLSMQIDPDRPNIFRLDDATRPATKEERASAQHMRPSTSFFKDAMARFVKNPVAMVSAVILIIILLIVILVPFFYPYDYSTQLVIDNPTGLRDSTYSYLNPFSYSDTEKSLMEQGQFIWPHIFGTDQFGRDYFIRVIYGARISLIVGIFAAIIVLIIGTIYGAISGYIGGKTDMIMMRIVDVIYSIPDVVIIILLSSVLRQVFESSGLADDPNSLVSTLGTGMLSIFVVFGLLYWVGMARLVRGQVLSLKQQEYVLASKATGASNWFVIRKHLIPNAMSVIIITAALEIPSAIFTESFLSFIGLGVSAPMPSLGSLASDARAALSVHPYMLIFPAIAICLIVLCFNLVGDGLRDAFDPKLKR